MPRENDQGTIINETHKGMGEVILVSLVGETLHTQLKLIFLLLPTNILTTSTPAKQPFH